MGYVVSMDVPVSLWQTTTGVEQIREHARRRATLRRMARSMWRDARRRGAPRVDRYLLVCMIAGRRESPVLAAETVKPIIDAGTDERMWPDDDPFHRVLTCYMRDPRTCAGNRPRITLAVAPVGRDFALPGSVLGLLPDARAACIDVAIPEREWLTSNMRLSPDEHWRRRDLLVRHVSSKWERVRFARGAACLCGVGYPDSRDEYQGDPDNTAETATILWGAGAMMDRAPVEPSCFMFYLLNDRSAPGMHDMRLFGIQADPETSWLTLLLDAAEGDA